MSLSKHDILEAIGEQPDRLGKRELSKILGIGADQKRELRMVLRELTDEGRIIRSDRRTYRLAGDIPDVSVFYVSEIDEDGQIFATPATWKEDAPAPQFRVIIRKPKGSAQREDAKLSRGTRILARLDKRSEPPTLSVIRILGEGPTEQLGVIVKTGRGLRIKPASKKDRNEYFPVDKTNLPEAGKLVLFQSQRQSRRSKDGFKPAKIVEVVGDADDPKAASLISLAEHNIPIGFPPEVEQEIADLPRPVLTDDMEDLRHIPLITIDPDDAKDFDDAVYAEPRESGGHIVWVAIADVARYVRPGSALDKTARNKGNSVYLPDRVEPMLPHALSSDLCSLRPHEDRYCLAVRMIFDEQGVKQSHDFHRGLMHSHARLTYEQAQAAFDGQPDETAQSVEASLSGIWNAYQALKIAREERAPLDIELPERRVRIGDDGSITAIEVKARFDANKLIEEFMIQANVAAAQTLSKKNTPLIYRVHEPPQRERLQSLSDFLPVVGMKFSLGERATPARFNRILEQADAKDLSEVVGMAVLRTQSQAIYSPDNQGHYGLSLTHYAHFTSPIRRYADLIVHRALIAAHRFGKDGQTDEEQSRLKEISEHISDTERRAAAAERDAVDRYIAGHLQERIGAKFAGCISGVTKFGLFITLDETGADGFVPTRLLGEERYRFDEKRRQLSGEQSGGTYKFGARVSVQLEEATPISGGLLFSMVSKPEPGKPGRASLRGDQRRRGKSKSKGKRRK